MNEQEPDQIDMMGEDELRSELRSVLAEAARLKAEIVEYEECRHRMAVELLQVKNESITRQENHALKVQLNIANNKVVRLCLLLAEAQSFCDRRFGNSLYYRIEEALAADSGPSFAGMWF
jgi:hypothetical protein